MFNLVIYNAIRHIELQSYLTNYFNSKICLSNNRKVLQQDDDCMSLKTNFNLNYLQLWQGKKA